MDRIDVPQGTLELLILTILQREPMHGYGIAQLLAEHTRGLFQVNAGSLFPALYRLEADGILSAEWGATENNRRAKYYRITATGKKQLARATDRWRRITQAVARVQEAT
jgi:PadR family transcriptional regulator PadR